jgi:hypothetical protein
MLGGCVYVVTVAEKEKKKRKKEQNEIPRGHRSICWYIASGQLKVNNEKRRIISWLIKRDCETNESCV